MWPQPRRWAAQEVPIEINEHTKSAIKILSKLLCLSARRLLFKLHIETIQSTNSFNKRSTAPKFINTSKQTSKHKHQEFKLISPMVHYWNFYIVQPINQIQNVVHTTILNQLLKTQGPVLYQQVCTHTATNCEKKATKSFKRYGSHQHIFGLHQQINLLATERRLLSILELTHFH